MKREPAVHFDGFYSPCVKNAARTSKHAPDVTCKRCVYRLWVYRGAVSDHDQRLTRNMFDHRIARLREFRAQAST